MVLSVAVATGGSGVVIVSEEVATSCTGGAEVGMLGVESVGTEAGSSAGTGGAGVDTSKVFGGSSVGGSTVIVGVESVSAGAGGVVWVGVACMARSGCDTGILGAGNFSVSSFFTVLGLRSEEGDAVATGDNWPVTGVFTSLGLVTITTKSRSCSGMSVCLLS